MKRLEELLGMAVQVVLYVNDGHHDVKIIEQGVLSGVQEHMVSVTVSLTQEDGQGVEVVEPANVRWYNTRAHTFSRIEAIN